MQIEPEGFPLAVASGFYAAAFLLALFLTIEAAAHYARYPADSIARPTNIALAFYWLLLVSAPVVYFLVPLHVN